MLELRKITKDYEVGEDKVHALKGVSLAFRKNEMVSILGQSGCGKTTLLNIIGGLDRYTDGDLIINDRSTKYFQAADWDAYRNQKIGFVFQSYNLIPHLTVLGNVELALTLSGIKKSERRARAIDALKRVGLESEIKKRPNQMSGGQMQRVAIARAIVNDPDIILADEPTGALDSNTSVTVMEILKEISQDRLVIMVTHNRDLAEKYSTRIISMLDGEVVDDTAPVAIAESEQSTSSATSDISDNANNSVAEGKEFAKRRKTEQKAITKANRAALKRTSMSFWTAFGLSWRNLITKKGRTIATAVAGSIGIIGVALVLALSNGFNGYIEDMQTSMLAHYPVTATEMTMDIDAMLQNMENGAVKLEQFPDGNKVVIKDDSTMAVYHYNRITKEYLDHIDNMPEGLAIDVTRDYAKTKVIVSANMQTDTGYGVVNTSNDAVNGMMGTNSSGFQQLLNNTEYVQSQYDVLSGKYPTAANEIAVVIGTDNSITRSTLRKIGFKIPEDVENATFDDLMGQEYKLILNDQWFSYDRERDIYVSFDSVSHSENDWKTLYDDENNVTLKVVGVMRIKESSSLALFSTGVVYTPALNELLIRDSMNSDVAKYQTEHSDRCVSDALTISMGSGGEFKCAGMQFSAVQAGLDKIAGALGMHITVDDIYGMALRAIGASDIPNALNFYPVTFSKKTDMINYLNKYNADKTEDDKIYTLDAASVVTSTVSDMIDIISYVLVAFAAISLVVSSVMISIITYASVVERIKEIGVLRAVGARKMDIMRVFNAETVIIGLAAGIIGVLITLILSFPLSSIFVAISDGMVATSLVVVSWWHALVLIGVSILLTLIAGMLPAMSAAKRDPVVALRSE